MDKYEIMEKMVEQVKATQPLWGRWSIKEYLGSGAFSKVYRIEAELPGGAESSALKIEAITAADVIVTGAKEKKEILEHKKEEAIKQVSIMSKFKSCPYIVRYEEMSVQPFMLNGQLEGYCLLIRMELLDEVGKLMNSGSFDFSESNVLRLALNVGEGIKALHKERIIHRDLKPQNLFASDNGFYKVGDFNVSKKTDTALSLAGAFPYMAPEVYRKKKTVDDSYTNQADIYSFGMCLYQMMNKRLPLEEKYQDVELAFEHRMQNESFEAPKGASEAFQYIIMKACRYEPSDRYASIHAMLADLDALASGKPLPSYEGKPAPVLKEAPKEKADPYETEHASPEDVPIDSPVPTSQDGVIKKNFLPLIMFAVLLVVIGGAAIVLPNLSKGDEDSSSSDDAYSAEMENVATTESAGGSTYEDIAETEPTVVEPETMVQTEAETTEPIPEEKTEIRISELDFMNSSASSGCFEAVSNQKDNVGNTYDYAFIQSYKYYYRTEEFNEYYVKKGYSQFIGTVFLLEEKKTYDHKLKFTIYGDEQILYSTEITGGCLPEDFSVDISNVDILKISVTGGGLASGVDSCIGIGNAILSND